MVENFTFFNVAITTTHVTQKLLLDVVIQVGERDFLGKNRPDVVLVKLKINEQS